MSKEPETEVREGWRVPEGYVLVPREPTQTMIEAGLYHNHQHNSVANMIDSYKAMVEDVEYQASISAAPTLSAVGGLDNSSVAQSGSALHGAPSGSEPSAAWRALEIWMQAFETGRTEPLYAARDYASRVFMKAFITTPGVRTISPQSRETRDEQPSSLQDDKGA